ncbi:MAG: 6-pyruvoyl-tetrahydropterin synthase-related protein [Spongiibacteraceae bacterium]
MPKQVDVRLKWAAIGCIVVVALIACAPLLLKGAVDGHSIEYNLVWLKHFSAQLATGEWYPRWLMGMNRGAGSPVFFYYAPLPFYLTSLGVALLPFLTLNAQLAAGECLLIALSGVAFFLYARHRVTSGPALLAACLYMLLPYHFEIDLWLRQDLGELTIYICTPLILLFTEKLLDQHTVEQRGAVAGLALAYAALMFSHLPSGLLFSLCLGCYVGVRQLRQFSRAALQQFAVAIVLGVALAAVYWVPALFTQQYIQTDKLWTPYFDFHRWLYPASSEQANPFTRRLILLINLTTILFTLFCAMVWWQRGRSAAVRLLPALVLMGAAWFLISPASVLLWEHAPALWKVQFPWRVVLVMDLATAIAAMYALQGLREQVHAGRVVLGLSAAGILLYCLVSADIKNTIGPVDNARAVTAGFYAVRDGLDAPEYTTPWSHLSPREIVSNDRLFDDQIDYNEKDGVVHVVEWSPREIELNVKLQRPTDLDIRQFYFPNWKIVARDLHTALIPHPVKHTGLMRIRAPAGQYQLKLAMVPLLQEWIGGTISAIALLLVGTLIIFRNGSARILRAGRRHYFRSFHSRGFRSRNSRSGN